MEKVNDATVTLHLLPLVRFLLPFVLRTAIRERLRTLDERRPAQLGNAIRVRAPREECQTLNEMRREGVRRHANVPKQFWPKIVAQLLPSISVESTVYIVHGSLFERRIPKSSKK